MIERLNGIKWREVWKKYRLMVLVLLLGFFLLLLPSEKKERSGETEGEEQTFSLAQTEKRMEEILGKIEGAGKLQVMLTLKSGSQLQLAEDTEESQSSDESESRRETVTIRRGSNEEEVVITHQMYPAYQGAVVVCQGADKAAVRLAITEAVAALTGLSSDRITVVKWNS